jgi:hypothetical protein
MRRYNMKSVGLVESTLLTLLGMILWIPLAIVRLWLVILGIPAILLSLVGDGSRNTPSIWTFWIEASETPAKYATSRWGKFYWWAIRNPTRGLKKVFKQPIPEIQPNPDRIVRSPTGPVSASRWMQSGIYWEYWYLRRVGKEYFEFRIGWKFVDGNDEFFPTIQIRKGG